MARGHWLVDVTAIVPRLKIASWRPPVQPPRSTLRMIRNSRVSRTVVSDQPQETAVGSEYIDLTLSKKRNRATSFVHPAFQADHMIRTVITGRHLKNTGCVQESSVDHLSLMFPMHVEPLQIRLKEKGFRAPSHDSHRLARIRIGHRINDVPARVDEATW
jgi:hypothetical protein